MIILSDGLVTNQTLFSGLDTTDGTSPSHITMPDYKFTVLRGSSVTVEFAGQAQPNEHMAINGFQLQKVSRVPEPSSLLLLAVGLIGLAASQACLPLLKFWSPEQLHTIWRL